jgi:hypothetical protein
MTYNNINLRTATIHDFTTDKKILVDEFGIEQPKEEYSQNLATQTRIKDLLDYAELTKNNELKNAVNKSFETELASFGFE